jgi:hypothetical protein
MSTYSTLNTLVEQKLANTSEIFYDPEMKRQAANDTVTEILQEYDIPEFIRKPTTTGLFTFTSGKASKPTDYFRMVKMWDVDSTGIEDKEYMYKEPADFDQLATTDSYYWTEDYDASDSTRKLYIKPTTTTSVYIRYIKTPTEMTDDSIDCGLSTQWNEAIALGTVMRLYRNAKMYDEAREMERLYRQKKADTYMAVKSTGGIKENKRLRSKYERMAYFN